MAVKKSKAVKVLVGNLMTKDGQTNGFTASDFILVMQSLGAGLDYAIFNNRAAPPEILKKYRHYKSEPVEIDKEGLKQSGVKIIVDDLLLKREAKTAKADIIRRSFLRHDSKKLAKLIWKIIH